MVFRHPDRIVSEDFRFDSKFDCILVALSFTALVICMGLAGD